MCETLEKEAQQQPNQRVWGHLDLETAALRDPARGLLQLRRSLRESGPITFSIFDVALLTYWRRAYPGEDLKQTFKDLLNDEQGVLGSLADNAPEWLSL